VLLVMIMTSIFGVWNCLERQLFAVMEDVLFGAPFFCTSTNSCVQKISLRAPIEEMAVMAGN